MAKNKSTLKKPVAPKEPTAYGYARVVKINMMGSIHPSNIEHDFIKRPAPHSEGYVTLVKDGNRTEESFWDDLSEQGEYLFVDPVKIAEWAASHRYNMLRISADYDGEIIISGVEASTETHEDIEARVEAENAAQRQYEADMQKYWDEMANYEAAVRAEQQAKKSAHREKFNDPDYIEFLRLQSKMTEKYGKDSV